MTRIEERDIHTRNPRKRTTARRPVPPEGKIGVREEYLLQDCTELVLGDNPEKFGQEGSVRSMDEALERLS